MILSDCPSPRRSVWTQSSSLLHWVVCINTCMSYVEMCVHTHALCFPSCHLNWRLGFHHFPQGRGARIHNTREARCPVETLLVHTSSNLKRLHFSSSGFSHIYSNSPPKIPRKALASRKQIKYQTLETAHLTTEQFSKGHGMYYSLINVQTD